MNRRKGGDRLLGWWRRRSSAARFDLYTRASLYVNFVVIPTFGVLAMASELGGALWWVLGLMYAHAALCVLLLRAGFNHYLGRGDRPVRLMIAAGALAVAGPAAAYLAFPDRTPGHPDGPATAVLLIAVGMFVAAASVAVPTSVTAGIILVGGGVLYGLSTLQGAPNLSSAVAYVMLLGFVAVAFRTTAWMCRLVWELDRARAIEAQLAVAEERLRFGRDLHDVVGRTLSVVALKAELAAQLAKRGRAEAIDEMLEVRRVAQDSLVELRTLVGGYRAVDPEVELAGARSLLASAGIDCRVAGDPAHLPGPFGWVLREGTTNILRHSEARTCVITVTGAAPGGTTMTIDNDGAPGEGPVRLGNGLSGLTERLAALGGTVTAERSGGRFRLTARLPAGDTARLPAGDPA